MTSTLIHHLFFIEKIRWSISSWGNRVHSAIRSCLDLLVYSIEFRSGNRVGHGNTSIPSLDNQSVTIRAQYSIGKWTHICWRIVLIPVLLNCQRPIWKNKFGSAANHSSTASVNEYVLPGCPSTYLHFRIVS